MQQNRTQSADGITVVRDERPGSVISVDGIPVDVISVDGIPAEGVPLQRRSDTSVRLAEVRRRRSNLAHAMSRLESAVSRPGPGRLPEWRRGVTVALDGLRDALLRHVEVTEADDSFQVQITERMPQLSPKVARLRRDHRRAHGLVAATYVALDAIDDDSMVEDVRERVNELLLHLSHHRQRGSDLIWEAFQVDVGGEQ